MNPIAQTADMALRKAFDANAFGEIKDHGAPWACTNYGETGHNYVTCPDCLGNFNRHMDAKEAA